MPEIGIGFGLKFNHCHKKGEFAGLLLGTITIDDQIQTRIRS